MHICFHACRWRGASAPWHATRDSIEYSIELAESTDCKVRSDWTRVPEYMGEAHKWKLAECIAFLDDQGLYKLNLLRFEDPAYRSDFNLVNTILAKIITHDITDRELTLKDVELRNALGVLETKMFYKWYTFTRHGLLHLCSSFIAHGRFMALNELDFERHHRILKNLTRGTKSAMKSLKNHLHLKSVGRTLQADPNVCPNPEIGNLYVYSVYFIHIYCMFLTLSSI